MAEGGRAGEQPGQGGAVREGEGRFLVLLAVGVGLAVLCAVVGVLPAAAAAGVALLLLALGGLWRLLR